MFNSAGCFNSINLIHQFHTQLLLAHHSDGRRIPRHAHHDIHVVHLLARPDHSADLDATDRRRVQSVSILLTRFDVTFAKPSTKCHTRSNEQNTVPISERTPRQGYAFILKWCGPVHSVKECPTSMNSQRQSSASPQVRKALCEALPHP